MRRLGVKQGDLIEKIIAYGNYSEEEQAKAAG